MKRIIFTLCFFVSVMCAHAQFRITDIKGKPGTPADLLSYPLISSPKTRVAAKIDSVLQYDILNNEVVVKDRSKIFNNTVYIGEPDSIAQSGHTGIGYEILLNNARVLSIRFDLESLGAYPENYTRYFCFDAQTGERLTEKDLFTEAGIKYWTIYLRAERAKRIREYLSGEIANVEDSAFARERFEVCNSEAGLSEFVIGKQHILFYKEYCFPHAWRAFDIDLNVGVDFGAIRKYLTSRGRKLLGVN